MAPKVQRLQSFRTLQPGAANAPVNPAAPGLRRLAQELPRGITDSPSVTVTEAGGYVSPEVARALPRSEGAAPPYQLQTSQTDLWDVFTTTIGESQLFLSTNRWLRVTLTLQTAGPVVVSTRSDVVPVLSGKGMSLVANQPIAFVIPRGARLYYGAASVQRFSVISEDIPWGNELAGKLDAVAAAVSRGASMMTSAIRALTGRR